MTEKRIRILAVEQGTVQCTEKTREKIEKCRFCVHSTKFWISGDWVLSPARAFCTIVRAGNNVDLGRVAKVMCDDMKGEGFRSLMNIIS